MNFDILVLMIFLAAISIIFGPIVGLIIYEIKHKNDLRNYILNRKPDYSAFQRAPEYQIFKFLTKLDSGIMYHDEWSYDCKNREILILSSCISESDQFNDYDEFKKLFGNWIKDPLKKRTKEVTKIFNSVSAEIARKGWLIYQLETCSGEVIYTDKHNHYRVIFSERLKVFQIVYYKLDSWDNKPYFWSSKYIKMDEIIGLEVKDAEKTIASDTRARNALVGSLLFGRIGALIGASLSSNNSSLLIRLNDTKNPVYEINCKDSKKLYELVTLFEIYEKKWS